MIGGRERRTRQVLDRRTIKVLRDEAQRREDLLDARRRARDAMESRRRRESGGN